MSSAIERVKAYREVLSGVGASDARMPHTTEQAVALAKEIGPKGLRHAARATAAIAVLDSLASKPEATDEAELRQLLNDRERARADFWDAFEGQEVEGVEIVRRAGK